MKGGYCMYKKINVFYFFIFLVTICLLLRQLYYFNLINQFVINGSVKFGFISLVGIVLFIVITVIISYLLPIYCVIEISLKMEIKPIYIHFKEYKIILTSNTIYRDNIKFRSQVMRC
jgi:hypothetical protein